MDLKIKYEKGFIKPDKNSLILLGIVLVSAILVGIGLFYYLKKAPEITIQGPPENPMKEIIKSLTAPLGEVSPISEETQESLSASSGSGGASEDLEDILKSLTAPE